MKRMLALVVLGALLTLGLSLVNPPQASADLKAVFTAVCGAYDDLVFTTSGPTPSNFAVCSASDCRALMVCMDNSKWHVIHDTRYGGAWFDPLNGAYYKLIFEHD